MTKCQGHTRDGSACRRVAIKNSRFCGWHIDQQGGSGGAGVDLSIGRNMTWKLLSKAQTQHKALEKVGNQVILPDHTDYKIQIPYNAGDAGVIILTLRGPIELKTLLRMVESEYEEHGANVRNIVNIADGSNVVALEHLGGPMYSLVLN